MKKLINVFIFLICIISVKAYDIVDLKLNLVENEINPDGPLRFQVNIFRLGEKWEDIYFQYFIKSEGNLDFIESESVAVEKIGSFFRTIELPRSVRLGENSLVVKASIKDEIKESVINFNVIKPKDYVEIPVNYVYYLFLFLLLIMIIFTLFMSWDYKVTLSLVKEYKIDEKDLR